MVLPAGPRWLLYAPYDGIFQKVCTQSLCAHGARALVCSWARCGELRAHNMLSNGGPGMQHWAWLQIGRRAAMRAMPGLSSATHTQGLCSISKPCTELFCSNNHQPRLHPKYQIHPPILRTFLHRTKGRKWWLKISTLCNLILTVCKEPLRDKILSMLMPSGLDRCELSGSSLLML